LGCLGKSALFNHRHERFGRRGRVVAPGSDMFHHLQRLERPQLQLVHDEVVRVLGFDVVPGQNRRRKVFEIDRDDRVGVTCNRSRQNVTVVRVWQ